MLNSVQGSQVFFINSPSIDSNALPSSILESNVADAICRGVGVQPYHSDYVPAFVKGSMVVEPSNFIFSVFAPDELALESLLTQPVPVETAGVAQHYARDLMSLVSGGTGTNLNTKISHVFGGKSLTMSVSGDSYLSRAACKPPAGSARKTNFCLYPDEAGVFPEHKIFSAAVNVCDILEGYSMQDNILVTPSGFAFDLTEEDVGKWFNELNYVYSVLTTLANPESSISRLVADAIPDSYSFAFFGLSDLAATSSTSSPKYTNAVTVLETALPQLLKMVYGVYPDAQIQVATFRVFL
jgi:hypothetical protein